MFWLWFSIAFFGIGVTVLLGSAVAIWAAARKDGML